MITLNLAHPQPVAVGKRVYMRNIHGEHFYGKVLSCEPHERLEGQYKINVHAHTAALRGVWFKLVRVCSDV